MSGALASPQVAPAPDHSVKTAHELVMKWADIYAAQTGNIYSAAAFNPAKTARMGPAREDLSRVLSEVLATPVQVAPTATASKSKCKTCGGSGVVDDGEIDCYEGGLPYENGPVKCVKDCPACATRAPVAPQDDARDAVEAERQVLRAEQAANVMPQIGPLLDAWEGLSNDTACLIRAEAPNLMKALAAINRAMEGAAPVAPQDDAQDAADPFTAEEKAADPQLYLHPEQFERRDDGKVVRKDRWEIGIRNAWTILGGVREEFEIEDVVDAVRRLAKALPETSRPLTKAERSMLTFLESMANDFNAGDWRQHGFQAKTYDNLKRKLSVL